MDAVTQGGDRRAVLPWAIVGLPLRGGCVCRLGSARGGALPGVLGGCSGTGERGVAVVGRGVMITPQIDARTGRLSVATVQHIERLVGGDALVEGIVLRFIAVRWDARNLLYLPVNVAAGIFDRPEAFIRTAKNHFEPELPF